LALRNRQLNGLKFVRQYSIGPYFVDFVCRERMIIVEIDGATHSTEQELSYDAKRADYLREQGYRIFCANNGDVYENLSGVLTALLEFATEQDG
jgi:very-short-patch-repair endonuclease